MILYVLVTAHPDDESLFFVPTLCNLQHDNAEGDGSIPHKTLIWLLCLTSGNYDGLGAIRVQELRTVCESLLTMIDTLLVVDPCDGTTTAPPLHDHPSQAWETGLAAKCIHSSLSAAIEENLYEQTNGSRNEALEVRLITFDKGGVSGHINHRDTFLAVRHLWEEGQSPSVSSRKDSKRQFQISQVWTLETEYNTLCKYLPVYSWWLLLLTWLGVRTITERWADAYSQDQNRIVFRLHHPFLNWRAMATHQSQFVWYRRLFVVFSSYTYVNVLRRLSTVNAPTASLNNKTKQS